MNQVLGKNSLMVKACVVDHSIQFSQTASCWELMQSATDSTNHLAHGWLSLSVVSAFKADFTHVPTCVLDSPVNCALDFPSVDCFLPCTSQDWSLFWGCVFHRNTCGNNTEKEIFGD